jgi:hypothetical protein
MVVFWAKSVKPIDQSIREKRAESVFMYSFAKMKKAKEIDGMKYWWEWILS